MLKLAICISISLERKSVVKEIHLYTQFINFAVLHFYLVFILFISCFTYLNWSLLVFYLHLN